MNSEFKEINTQRGAVLIVALIMLLLLTLVGLSGMRGTSLQENMASNLRESQVAYQAAEAALQMCSRIVASKYDNDDCPFDTSAPTKWESYEYSELEEEFTKVPHCEISNIYNIEPTLDTAKSEVSNGLLVRIDASGYGLAVDKDNKPITQTVLRATYEITCPPSASE